MNNKNKVEIVLPDVEYEYLENVCEAYVVDASNFIRRLLANENRFKERDIAESVFSMQTKLNLIKKFGAKDEYIEALSREVWRIWRCLN